MTGPAATAAALERVLEQERRRNCRYLNTLRFAGAALFLVVQAIADSGDSRPLALFALLSAVLFFGARRSERLARLSALAVPFLDMPAVFLVQWGNAAASIAPRAVANFTLGVFVLLILFSAFTLQKRQLVFSGVIATALLLVLQFRAQESRLGMAAGVVVIVLALLICEFAIHRRLAMAQALAREQMQRERLGRYFSPLVAAQIQQSVEDLPPAQHCEVTVLFSDLRDFTGLSEHLPPAAVMALLNDVHSRLVKVVFEHEGTLDKFIGDGLMAYFGAPVPQPDHALRALRCAVALQAALTDLNAARAARGEPLLHLSVGLHSGLAIVGAMGAENRREFTAIGDTVNLAARLEHLTRQFQASLLISGETARHIGSAFALLAQGEVAVRGRSEPVRLFTLDPTARTPEPRPDQGDATR